MAIRMEPNSKHYGSRGWCHLKLGRFAEAQKDYGDALRLEKDNTNFHYERGIVFFELNEWKEAQGSFETAINLSGLSPVNNAKAHFYLGICLRNLEKLEQSLKIFRTVINMEDNSETKNEMGLTFSEMENYVQAKKCFKEAIKLVDENDQVDPKYLNNLGLACYHLNQTEEAIINFTEALEMGEDAAVYFNRGNVHFLRNEFELSFQNYIRAVELEPSAQYYHHVGLAYQSLQDINNAIEYYKKAINVPGEDAYVPSLLHLGIMFHLDGQFAKAIEVFTHPALPEDETLLERRGLVYREMGHYQDAVIDFDKAIALRQVLLKKEKEEASELKRIEEEKVAAAEAEAKADPKVAAALAAQAAANPNKDKEPENPPPPVKKRTILGDYYYYRGNVYLRNGDHQMAIDDFNSALKKGLDNKVNCLNDRGLAYRALGNLSQACDDLSKACELSESAEVWCNRAQCWFEQGLYDRADTDLCRALVYDPNDAQIYYKRGITRYGQKEYENAILDLKEALRLDAYSTTVPDIHYHLGISYSNLNRNAPAVESFTDAIELMPERVHYYHERAKCLQLLGEHEKAVDDFTRVLQWQPTNSRALFRRGFSYKSLKAYEEAAEDFEAAKEFDPSDTRLILNYRRLHGIQAICLGVAGLEDPDVWTNEKCYDASKMRQHSLSQVPLKHQPGFPQSPKREPVC